MRVAAAVAAVCALALGGAPRAAEPLPRPGPPPALKAPAGMQYLYGSGEAAALTRGVWASLIDYVAKQVRRRPANSAVLAAGASLASPAWVPCGKKPFAAVFDVDETVLLNAGFEYDAARGSPYSDLRWAQWEVYGATKPIPTPGAREALARLRALGVTVIFNTNRSEAHAAESATAIEHAGLGPARWFADPAKWREQTLYLADATPGGRKKDGRRDTIADHYCVLAMGGDQLGDFSDLFNAEGGPVARRGWADGDAIARLWGAGWFVFPNPVYGTGLGATIDETFPAGTRWPDPSEPESK